MKQRTDRERLLDEVLSAEPDSAFSANVLAETLRGVRRQRHVRQIRRYGVVLAAVATPGGDPFSMFVMAVPLIILYFASLGLCAFVEKLKKRGDDA